MLTQNQKLYILFTKGYFAEYEQPDRVIVGDALMLQTKDVSDQNLLHYAIRVFDGLMTLGAIDDVGSDKYAWVIQEMRDVATQRNAPTLIEWLHAKIEWANCDGLDIPSDVTTLTKKMQRK